MSEKEKQYYKEFPIGTGRESEPKETLPAIEVANEVIWLNPDFKELPFDIKEGEPTKLGVFLTPKPKRGEKTLDLKASEEHKRSGLLGRAIFKDKQGRLYRDIDLKGAGFLKRFPKEGFRVLEPEILDRAEKTAAGILEKKWAEPTKDKAEKLFSKGIRTERYIALIKLKEIIDKNGEKISIKEAIEKGILNEEQEPVIALRAFGTKFRVIDSNKEKLEDARKLVAQELGIDEKKFSWKKYLEWFSETAGKNLGVMHKNKWKHGYLFPHNITLDCRIIDLDAAEDISSLNQEERKKKMDTDYLQLRRTIFERFPLFSLSPNLLEFVDKATAQKFKFNTTKSREELLKIFNDSYIKALGRRPKFLLKEES